MIRDRVCGAAMAIVASLGLVGCVSDAEQSQPSAEPEPESGYVETEPDQVDECMHDGDTGLELAGSGLEAIAYGDGEIGVMLVHGTGQSPCAWDEFGRRIADEGFSVLAAAYGSNSPIDDLQHGADWMLEHGATSIVLVGASAGAAHSIVAATRLDPVPVGLVALSPPVEHAGSDALAAIPDASMPTLLVAAPGDGDFVASAEQLADASQDAEVRVVEDGGHGTHLLEDDETAQAVIDLLESV